MLHRYCKPHDYDLCMIHECLGLTFICSGVSVSLDVSFRQLRFKQDGFLRCSAASAGQVTDDGFYRGFRSLSVWFQQVRLVKIDDYK